MAADRVGSRSGIVILWVALGLISCYSASVLPPLTLPSPQDTNRPFLICFFCSASVLFFVCNCDIIVCTRVCNDRERIDKIIFLFFLPPVGTDAKMTGGLLVLAAKVL
jgi:hypothetical protein